MSENSPAEDTEESDRKLADEPERHLEYVDTTATGWEIYWHSAGEQFVTVPPSEQEERQ